MTRSRDSARRLEQFEDLARVDDEVLRQLGARVHIMDLAYAFGTADPALLERLLQTVRPGLAAEIRNGVKIMESERSGIPWTIRCAMPGPYARHRPGHGRGTRRPARDVRRQDLMAVATQTYGVAIIGTGRISGAHARATQNVPTTRLVAASEVDEARGQEFAAKWGCEVVRDYHDLLARDDVHIVALTLPHFLHCPVAIEARRPAST